MRFDAHARAFAFFGGVPTRGIYNNMKTAVTSVFTSKERGLQPALPDQSGEHQSGSLDLPAQQTDITCQAAGAAAIAEG